MLTNEPKLHGEMYMVTHKYSDTVISEHFRDIFLLFFAQVKVSDKIKLDLFLQAFFFEFR